MCVYVYVWVVFFFSARSSVEDLLLRSLRSTLIVQTRFASQLLVVPLPIPILVVVVVFIFCVNVLIDRFQL